MVIITILKDKSQQCGPVTISSGLGKFQGKVKSNNCSYSVARY